MFEIDRERNRLHPLERRDLSDLGFRERNDLQEWLAARPDVFGEELLIIQKEFEGFPHSRERLDLLALDKNGRLVVIENKLGECSREVFGQAVPYAAYASRLSADEIIEEYGRFLRFTGQAGDPGKRISAFLESGQRSRLDLNAGGAPRIFLVASAFTPGLMISAEWLGSCGVSIECFKISALTRGDDQFLQCDRVLPLEAEHTAKGTQTTKPTNQPKIAAAHEEINEYNFWKYVVPLFCDAGLVSRNKLRIGSNNKSTEATFGRSQLRVRVGGRGAMIEVSTSEVSSDADQHVLRRLSSVRVMLDPGLRGAILKFSGGSNRTTTISASKSFDLSQDWIWPEISLWLIENSAKLIKLFEVRKPIEP